MFLHSAAPSLFDRIIHPENLRWAWRRVRDNRGAAGADGISLQRFGNHLETNIRQLIDEVRSDTYQPGPYRRVTLHERGKTRQIAILTVRDRVLQRATIDILGPLADATFLPGSYGYRPDLSLHDAVREIVRAHTRGFDWVVDADIRKCFDRFDHALLRQEIAQLVSEAPVRALFDIWISGPPRPRKVQPTVGIPQGAVISPLLCNLCLHRFDERMARRRYKVVRYADDFVVLCRSERHAERALRATERVLAGLKLELNTQKTQITSFDDGFDFLGVRFTGDDYRYQVEGRNFVIEDGEAPAWFYEHPENHY
jgi:group II intron reverse transcriptase/maturase